MLLRIVFLLATYFSIPGTSGQSALLKKADSLRLAGYTEEEILLRKAMLKPGDTLARVSYLLAKANLMMNESDFDNSAELLKEIGHLQKKADIWTARTLIRLLNHQQKYEESHQLLKRLIPPRDQVEQALTELATGHIYMEEGMWPASIEALEKAGKILLKNRMEHHFIRAIVLNDLGIAYDEAGIHNKMIKNYEEALDIITRYYPGDFREISSIFNNLIFSYSEYGDKKKAMEAQQQYETYMEGFISEKSGILYRTYPYTKRLSSISLYFLSNCRYYSFIFDKERIESNIGRMERLFSTAPSSWKEENLGHLKSAYDSGQYGLRKNGFYRESVFYALKMKKEPSNDFFRMKMHAALALNYYDQKHYQKALEETDKSLNSFAFEKRALSYNTLMVLKAELLAYLGRHNAAAQTINDLYLRLLSLNKGRIKLISLRAAHFPGVNNGLFINVLIHSGHVYRLRFQNHGNHEEDYRISRNFYRLAGEIFKRYYQSGLYNDQLGTYLDDIREGLYYGFKHLGEEEIKEDIELVESISSRHLWRRFLSKYMENINLPREQIDARNRLQMEYNLLKTNPSHGDTKLKQLKKELEKAEQDILRQNPAYSRFEQTNPGLKEIQRKLGPETVVLKYSVTDSTVFLHRITPGNISLFRLGSVNMIRQTSQLLTSSLKSIDFQYGTYARMLYRQLIAPAGLTGKQSLVIIPENFLSYLPFETLFWAENNKLPSVSYSYDLKLLGGVPSGTRKYDFNLTGFAPDYHETPGAQRQGLSRLEFSAAELKNIQETVAKSRMFTGKQAGKANFISTLGSSKIHHLAMHAEMDSTDYEQSALIFHDYQKLFFHELYTLNFPSEMVVLSACNTGVGTYQNGEGLMSISKALNYAGVKTYVHSLWKIPDKETSQLMDFFYQYLKEGYTKDEALSRAKESFILKNSVYSHPFYWAGFVISGDTSPIGIHAFGWWYLIPLLAILFLAAWFIFLKKRKSIPAS